MRLLRSVAFVAIVLLTLVPVSAQTVPPFQSLPGGMVGGCVYYPSLPYSVAAAAFSMPLTCDKNSDMFVAPMGVYNTSPPSLTPGQVAQLQLDANGNLKGLQFGTYNSAPANCTSGSACPLLTDIVGRVATNARLQDGSGNPVSSTSGALNVAQQLPVTTPYPATGVAPFTGTTCTSVVTGAHWLVNLHDLGMSNENAYIQIYNEGASPTCSANDVMLQLQLNNGGPFWPPLGVYFPAGIAWKWSSAPASTGVRALVQ